MRNEVFRVGAEPSRNEGARVIDLDGEVMWLLDDLMTLRGAKRQLALRDELLMQIPDDEAERVWVLFPGKQVPGARWVVTADGASVAHDVLAARADRRRRRTRTGPATPAWKVAGSAPHTNEEN